MRVVQRKGYAMKSIITKLLILVIALFLTACSVSEDSSDALPPTIAIENTVPVANTATIASIPSATHTPTTEPTKTPLDADAKATSTPLMKSTLSSTEWASIIDISIRKNIECELPCWLSLIPGETTEDDAVRILQENQMSINDKYVGDTGRISYTIKNEFGMIRMIFEKGVLDYIFFDYIMTHPEFLINGSLLEQLGVPEKLLFNYSGIDGLPLFDILMIYEELQTTVMYSGRTESQNAGLSICDHSIIHITVWLTSRNAVKPTPYFREGYAPIPEPEFYNINSNDLLKFLGSEIDCITFDSYP